jgi:putative Mn2+ efflux pump MntP
MKPTTLLVLSIATSIDALAVGFSFSMLDVRIWIAVLIIGIGSFLFSVGGFYMGKFLSSRLKPTYAEILGGVILIIIGIKILIQHLNM